MPRRRQAGDLAFSPADHLAGFEGLVDPDGRRGRAHIARAMDGVLVRQRGSPFAEVEGPFKKLPFRCRGSDLGALAVDAADSLALLPVMVGEQDPVNVFDAGLFQMGEDLNETRNKTSTY